MAGKVKKRVKKDSRKIIRNVDNTLRKSYKKEDFSLGKEYKKSFFYLREIKNYLYFVLIGFFVLALIGYFLHGFVEAIYGAFFGGDLNAEIMQYIQDLILQTQGMGAKELIGFIFLNNFQSSLMGLVLGAFFGIMPIIAVVTNGYLLGFVALLTVKEAGVFVLWRIFPHGIFELPAVFIALGMGVKLGDYLLRKSENFLRSFLYLILTFFISVISFGFIVLFFNLLSSVVTGQPFYYDLVSATSSVIMFLIFFTILLIALLLGLFIFEKEQRSEMKRIITNSLRVFLLIVFPLLVIAAIIEGILIAISG